jgi:protein phosphatase
MVIDYPGGQRAVAAPRKTPVRRLALVAIFLVALLAIFAVRGALANSWYVGIDRDRVAIFNGVPSSVAGFRLSRVAERTDLQAASLPDPVREDLQNGIKAEDRSDAREIVANLRQFPQLTSPAAQGESESSYTPVSNP